MPEVRGTWTLPEQKFVLRGRADRIERYPGGQTVPTPACERDTRSRSDTVILNPACTPMLIMRAPGAVKFDKIDYSDTKIRVYGDSAVVTTTADVVGHSKTTGDLSGRYRYTRVYTRHNKDGAWRIVSFEYSRVKQDH